jgi:hypothetical protein
MQQWGRPRRLPRQKLALRQTAKSLTNGLPASRSEARVKPDRIFLIWQGVLSCLRAAIGDYHRLMAVLLQ